MEAYFRANEVPASHQLPVVLSAIPLALAVTIKDLVLNPPPDATYQSIKGEILARTTQSAEKRFRTLVPQ